MPTIEIKLRELLPDARRRAEAIGPLHASWDVIVDAEEWLAGRETLLSGTRDEVGRRLVMMLTDKPE